MLQKIPLVPFAIATRSLPTTPTPIGTTKQVGGEQGHHSVAKQVDRGNELTSEERFDKHQ
jgi:hypothetical protein